MNRTIDYFLKYEVDDWDADSNYIYLKLDKDRFDFPIMPINKSELRLWALLTFAPCGDEDLQAELERNSKELEVYKKAYEMVCNSLSDKTACEWGYDEACMACRQRLGSIRTTSCVDFIKNFYLQKAREE